MENPKHPELEKAIQASGYRKEYLAGLLEMKKSHFSKKLRGDRRFTRTQKLKLAKFLKKRLYEVFPTWRPGPTDLI